ncbi:hypothetical protein BC826DRAFT_552964 [Russula brevipes]|nr:hypothetical protein BC826DRAFT_552964 [Russula brevipes]
MFRARMHIFPLWFLYTHLLTLFSFSLYLSPIFSLCSFLFFFVSFSLSSFSFPNLFFSSLLMYCRSTAKLLVHTYGSCLALSSPPITEKTQGLTRLLLVAVLATRWGGDEKAMMHHHLTLTHSRGVQVKLT